MLTKIVKFPVTTGDWTPIVPPFDCSYFGIIGNEDGSGNRLDIPVQRSTDQTPETTYSMKQDESYGVIVPARFGAYRYLAPNPIGYFRAIGQACTVICEFFE